ncbi:MAG: hypothetical protein LCH37_14555 [Bacteroidetes bacterium]|nr:hypothetical protein [Bacteroidota bacterium]MCK6610344.1 hypothetical protein [Bacteroidia bacterium]
MEFIIEIKEQINLINEVLIDLKQSLLLDNQDFILDEMTAERYLKLKYISPNHINFIITITPFGTNIDVDRAMEAYDVGKEYVNNNKTDYKAFFLTLFTSRIKVEYFGSNYTKIYFYDDSGTCIKTLKFVTGLYLKIGCKIKEYSPIYTK